MFTRIIVKLINSWFAQPTIKKILTPKVYLINKKEDLIPKQHVTLSHYRISVNPVPPLKNIQLKSSLIATTKITWAITFRKCLKNWIEEINLSVYL